MSTDFNTEEGRCLKQLQQLSLHNNPCSHDVPWSCNPISPHDPPASSGWGNPWAQVAPATEAPLSAEDQALVSAVQTQSNALKASVAFFTTSTDDDEDDDDGNEEVEEEEGLAFLFFVDMFKKDGELRDYYKENWKKGEFYCLVCGGIGKKVWKRFASCAGLVQHSTSISRTKRRLAHREFAKAVCLLLGWDTFVQVDFAKENDSDGEWDEDIEDVDGSSEELMNSTEDMIAA